METKCPGECPVHGAAASVSAQQKAGGPGAFPRWTFGTLKVRGMGTGLLLLTLCLSSACRRAPEVAFEPPPDRSDRDLDGLLDRQDDCPGKPETYNGNRDLDGCPDPDLRRVSVANGQLELKEQIKFAGGKAVILADSFPILEDVYGILTDRPTLKIRIEGHTDDKGNPVSNQKLSEARARAIQGWLVAKGLDASRLTAEGKGSSTPKVPNTSDEARALNRRVEFHMVAGL